MLEFLWGVFVASAMYLWTADKFRQRLRETERRLQIEQAFAQRAMWALVDSEKLRRREFERGYSARLPN